MVIVHDCILTFCLKGYWINNVGINGGRRALSELTMQQVETVVKVNLLGIFYCTKVAMDIMA
jgi:NAD(P)-dependent dehydrogenase (short-subunit alcohol dehydrogenase family)